MIDSVIKWCQRRLVRDSIGGNGTATEISEQRVGLPESSWLRVRSLLRDLPFLRRRLAVLRHEVSVQVTYYRRPKGTWKICDVRPMRSTSSRSALRSIPTMPVIVDWDRTVRRTMHLEGVPLADVSAALPYQISLSTPFAPDELVWIERGVTPTAQNSWSVDIEFSQEFDSLSARLQGLKSSCYPSAIYPERLVWERYFASYVEKHTERSADHTAFICFAERRAHIGLVSVADGKAMGSTTVNLRPGDVTGQAFESLIRYLEDRHETVTQGHLARILVQGPKQLVADLIDGYADRLPARCERVDLDSQVVDDIDGGVPSVACAWIVLPSAPLHLEPREPLQRSVFKDYIISQAVSIVVIFLIGVLVYTASLYADLWRAEDLNQSMTSELVNTESSRRRLLEMRNAVVDRQHTVEQSKTVLTALIPLASSVPKGISMNEIEYTQGGRWSIRGVADSPELPVDFARSLERLPGFTDVRLEHVAKHGNAESESVGFHLVVRAVR